MPISVDTGVVVDLGGFEGLALIVRRATGVIYEQLSAGRRGCAEASPEAFRA